MKESKTMPTRTRIKNPFSKITSSSYGFSKTIMTQLIISVLLGFAMPSEAQVGIDGDTTSAFDWTQYAILKDSFQLPVVNGSPLAPGVYSQDVFLFEAGPSGGDASGYHWGTINSEYSEAATDWIAPYYGNHVAGVLAGFYEFDNSFGVCTNGLGTLTFSWNLDPSSPSGSYIYSDLWNQNNAIIEGINAEIDSYLSTTVYHATQPDAEYLRVETSATGTLVRGETVSIADINTNFPSGLTYSLSTETNATAATYHLVTVPPMTIAFLGNQAPVFNLCSLSSSFVGGCYKEGTSPPAYATLGAAIWTSTIDSVDNPGGTQYSLDWEPTTGMWQSLVNGERPIKWYGSYSASLLQTVSRNALDQYTSAKTGDIIGQLVTFEVVPAHPSLFQATGLEVSDIADRGYSERQELEYYAFEVAMQLGRVVAVSNIYSGTFGANPPAAINTPPITSSAQVGTPTGNPSYPVAPVIIPANGSGPVLGVSISDSSVTENMEVDLTAQNGSLSVGNTTGLTVTGNGSSSLSLVGSVSNVNAALASLVYTPNSGFVGYDVIQVIADDLFNNANSVVTAIVPVTVAPTVSAGQFVTGGFQFTINASAGPNWKVSASTDLVNWTYLGDVSLTGSSTTFVDTSASSFTYRFYRVTQDAMCSGALGFINVTVPANNANGTGGYAMIANQLNNPAGNTLANLIPSAPNGTEVLKWDVTSGTWGTSSIFTTRGTPGWSSGSLTMNPGEAAFIQNPTTIDCCII